MTTTEPPEVTVRFSLSQREVSDTHIMLSTLPFPPLPVHMTLDASGLENEDVRNAFVVATSALVLDGTRGDGTVNSHSIIAALSLFHKWSARCRDAQIDALAKSDKEGATLDLVGAVLHFNSTSTNSAKTDFVCSEAQAMLVFFETTRAWVQSYLPHEVKLTLRTTDATTLPHEHDLHISMAHYCHAQGVLYSSKGSLLVCDMHETMLAELKDRVQKAKDDPDDDSATNKLDNEECRHMGMELAELYSKYPFGKLLILCAKRLHKDALYGYKEVDMENVYENAKALLDSARSNYERTVAARVCEGNETTHALCVVAEDAAETILDPTVQPVLEPASKPEVASVVVPVEETGVIPVEETGVIPMKASVVVPVEASVVVPVEASVVVPVAVPVEVKEQVQKPVMPAVKEPVEEAVMPPVKEPVEEAVMPPVKEPVDESIKELLTEEVIMDSGDEIKKVPGGEIGVEPGSQQTHDNKFPVAASYRSALGVFLTELVAVSPLSQQTSDDKTMLWRGVCVSLEVCVYAGMCLWCVSVLGDILPLTT